jgi:hypothetical protein
MPSLMDEKISTNIITNRIIVDKLTQKDEDSPHSNDFVDRSDNPNLEEKRLFKRENKRKLKRFKKSENINIKIENTEKNIQVNHKCKIIFLIKYYFRPF